MTYFRHVLQAEAIVMTQCMSEGKVKAELCPLSLLKIGKVLFLIISVGSNFLQVFILQLEWSGCGLRKKKYFSL